MTKFSGGFSKLVFMIVFLSSIFQISIGSAQQVASAASFGSITTILSPHPMMESKASGTPTPASVEESIPAARPGFSGSGTLKIIDENGLVLKRIQKFNLAEIKFSGVHQFKFKTSDPEYRAVSFDVPNFTPVFPPEVKWDGATFTVSFFYDDVITVSSFSMTGFVNIASKTVSGVFESSFRKSNFIDQTWKFKLTGLPMQRIGSDSVFFHSSGGPLQEFFTMISCVHLPNFGKYQKTDYTGTISDVQSSHMKYLPFLSLALYKN